MLNVMFLIWFAVGLFNVVATSRNTFQSGFLNWLIMSSIFFLTGPVGLVLIILMYVDGSIL